jgi:hypothetical protein
MHAGNSEPHQYSATWNAEIAQATITDYEKTHRCYAHRDNNRQDRFDDIVVYEHLELHGHHGDEMH